MGATGAQSRSPWSRLGVQSRLSSTADINLILKGEWSQLYENEKEERPRGAGHCPRKVEAGVLRVVCAWGGAVRCWRGREGPVYTTLLKIILKKKSRITELNEQKCCESSLFFSANKLTFIWILPRHSKPYFQQIDFWQIEWSQFSQFRAHQSRHSESHLTACGVDFLLHAWDHKVHDGKWHHIRLWERCWNFYNNFERALQSVHSYVPSFIPHNKQARLLYLSPILSSSCASINRINLLFSWWLWVFVVYFYLSWGKNMTHNSDRKCLSATF